MMKVQFISRRHFLKRIGFASFAITLPFAFDSCHNNTKKPNILLILTDDQGWGDINSHGNAQINTPVMDHLADTGARFDRFYVSPVCSPTRASLLTGRYHLRSGVNGVTRGRETMRSEEVTIAEILQASGYKTGCFGKWHNGAHYPYHPNGQGFHEFLGFCAGHWNNYFDTQLEENGQSIKTKGYIADVLTDSAINFIKKYQHQPFFCYVPYNPPHSPFQVPDHYFNKYKALGLDDTLACVYAMCENLDDNIGRILKTLDSCNLSDNTIVIFITDNGPNTDRYNGDMRGRKGSVHEGGVRVPCFIRWPGKIDAGKMIPKIAAHIDILPTLLDLVEIKKPASLELDGRSLVPLLRQKNPDWKDRSLFTYWANRGAVRTPQYRLIIQNETIELYDMIKDPQETYDISKENSLLARQLKKKYDAWLNEVTKNGFDPIPIPIGYPEWPQVILPGHEAFLYNPNGAGISYVGQQGWANDWITHWTDIHAFPYWEVEIVSNGLYQITLMYSCKPEDVGSRLEIIIGNSSIQGKVERAHYPDFIFSPDRVKRKEVYEKRWAALLIGNINLTKGRTRLTVKAVHKPGKNIIDLKAVQVNRVI